MEDEFNEENAEYMSKLPKSMLLAIIARLMKLLGEVHIVCLEDTKPDETLEIVKEKYVNPDNLTILLVTRIILNKLAHLPYEAAMIEMEREDFFSFWKESLSDTQEFVANAELDVLLHELGIDRPTEDD